MDDGKSLSLDTQAAGKLVVIDGLEQSQAAMNELQELGHVDATSFLKKAVAVLSGRNPEEVSVEEPLGSLGLGAVAADRLVDAVRRRFPGRPLTVPELFAFPSLSAAANHLETAAPTGADIAKQVVALVAEILELEPSAIAPTDDFFSLGGNSLRLAELLVFIEAECKVTLSREEVMSDPSIPGLIVAVKNKARGAAARANATADDGALISLSPAPSGAPSIVLVHPATGDAYCYGELVTKLRNQLGVRAFLPPGYSGIGKPLDTLEKLASRYADLLCASSDVHEPYGLAGWSYGGALVIELARVLRARGKKVSLIGMFDSVAPARLVGGSLQDQRNFAFGYLKDLARRAGLELAAIGQDAPPELDPDASIVTPMNMMRDELIRLGVLPKGYQFTWVEVFDANLRAYRAHHPARFEGPCVLYRARDESAFGTIRADRALGWEGIVERIELVDVPGSHFSLLADPAGVEIVAADLVRRMRA